MNHAKTGTVNLTDYTNGLAFASGNSIRVDEIDVDFTAVARTLCNCGLCSASSTGDRLIHVPHDAGLHGACMYRILPYDPVTGLTCYGIVIDIDELTWSNTLASINLQEMIFICQNMNTKMNTVTSRTN